MDHLLAADILLGEQAAVNIHGSTASFSHIIAHVFFFTNLVVDKLWHGKYISDDTRVQVSDMRHGKLYDIKL